MPDLLGTITRLREARLRPQWAEGYPGLHVGVWLPACRVASEVRCAGFPELNRSGVSGRLPEEAFEFRGGRSELVLRPRARTRWSDHPGPYADLRVLRPA
jgi:hypothetical protein